MEQLLFKRRASVFLFKLPFQRLPLRRHGIAIGGIKPQIKGNCPLSNPHRFHPQDLAQTRCFEPFAVLDFLFFKASKFLIAPLGYFVFKSCTLFALLSILHQERFSMPVSRMVAFRRKTSPTPSAPCAIHKRREAQTRPRFLVIGFQRAD